jgi:hypothetical protein
LVDSLVDRLVKDKRTLGNWATIKMDRTMGMFSRA